MRSDEEATPCLCSWLEKKATPTWPAQVDLHACTIEEEEESLVMIM